MLVAIAATHLTETGLDVLKHHLAPEPELTLYAHLQDERDDAYLHYNALLNRLNSFCNIPPDIHHHWETAQIS